MTHITNAVTKQLLELRRAIQRPVPLPTLIPTFVQVTLSALFPHFSPGAVTTERDLSEILDEARSLLTRLSEAVINNDSERASVITEFMQHLPEFHRMLWSDAIAICDGDPAATSPDEVVVAYPGFFAIAIYRMANWLYQKRVPILPRMLTEHAHQLTGIDIHPGATIGKAFVIDHGTGIVIGETTIIEDHVKIYQGVTLGALSVDKSLANSKRHPTICHHTVIYANATILGGDTIIGAHSTIGGNVWLISSVPERSRIYHRPNSPVA